MGLTPPAIALRYSAGIVPNSQVDLAFKSGGYVENILQVRGADGRMRNIQEGDWVARGTVLARVRESDYVANVNVAKAQLAQAQAALEQARLDFERTDALFCTDSVTTPQYDAAKARLDSTTAGVNSAASGLTQAETALNDCALRAPLDAWVIKRSVEVGSLVGPAVLGFSLAETRLVKAVFGVPDLVVGSLKLGEPQAITTAAATGQFNGRITAIAPAADPRTRTFSIEVTVPNSGNVLRPGMVATLVLSGSHEAESHPGAPDECGGASGRQPERVWRLHGGAARRSILRPRSYRGARGGLRERDRSRGWPQARRPRHHDWRDAGPRRSASARSALMLTAGEVTSHGTHE